MAQIYIAGIHTDAGKTHFSAAFCYAFRESSYGYFKLIQAGKPTDKERVKEILDLAFDCEKSADLGGQKFEKIDFEKPKLSTQDFGVADFGAPKSKIQICKTQDGKTQAKNQIKPHKITLHKEGIKLTTPTSPHIAKLRENLQYNGLEIPLPNLREYPNCIIELAGGLYTPLDDEKCMIDFMRKNARPCVLVGRYYLGCINHILLSLEALKQANIQVLCVAMSGEKSNESAESKTPTKLTKSTKLTKTKESKNTKNIKDSALVDKFIRDYAGVPIVHLPFFDTPQDFITSAKILKKQMLDKIDFAF